MNTQEIEKRLAPFERMTDGIKLPPPSRSNYRRMWLEEIAERLDAARECFIAIERAETDEERKEFQQNATLLLTIVERKIKQLLSQ